MEIVIIGSSKFLLGFRLAGVKKCILATRNTVSSIIAEQSDGLIIVENQLIEKFTDPEKEKLLTSINPIIIALSDQPDQQNAELRRSILRALGTHIPDEFDKE